MELPKLTKVSDPVGIKDAIGGIFSGSYITDVKKAQEKGITFSSLDYYHAWHVYAYQKGHRLM